MDNTFDTEAAAMAAVPAKTDIWRRGRRVIAIGGGKVHVLQHPRENEWRWREMEKVR